MENNEYMEVLRDIINIQKLAKEKIKNGEMKEAKKYLYLSKSMLESLSRYGLGQYQTKVS